MRIFVTEQDRISYIRGKLRSDGAMISVQTIKQWPTSIAFITWSFGEAESDHRYREVFSSGKETICQVTTLFGVWIVSSRFYEKTLDGYERCRR
ncbi:hypothetical protein CLV84_0431 [Neolewinella xylanilytica]|uniref:Uncharacterized protein n=1 Tax=Neolewinella xylanilytica TaxID=1514080 RepID=A0A2S6I7N2_9BACT|nr:hypothetical protein [Neolewinella xylanilytica]PPK87488.1 hypothetical protein CLV84_0431 [Neolewinella xylanilytica]